MSEPVTYEIAEDAKPIGAELIKQFHPHLLGMSIPLLYIFRSKAAESNGKTVLGKAKRVSGMNAFLAYRHLVEEGEDYPPLVFVIELAKDYWYHLTPEQRVALVDHELCHFGPDGMRAHDVEEFREVIDRHGLWRPDLEKMALTMAQHQLFPNHGTFTEVLADVAERAGELRRMNPDTPARDILRTAISELAAAEDRA